METTTADTVRELWNKGKLVVKNTVQAQGNMGHSNPASDRSPLSRPRTIQSGCR